MSRNDQNNIFPEDDFVIPGPGGSKRPAPPRRSGGGRRQPLKLGIVKMPFIVLMFFLRPVLRMVLWMVLWMVLPFIAMSLMVSVATWYWSPSAFHLATDLMFNVDSTLDFDNWIQQAKQLGENLPTVSQQVPQDAGPELSKQLEVVQRKLFVDGEIPSTLLSPQPQQ